MSSQTKKKAVILAAARHRTVVFADSEDPSKRETGPKSLGFSIAPIASVQVQQWWLLSHRKHTSEPESYVK
jgi:hypothetical protein